MSEYRCPECGSTNIYQPEDPYDDYCEEWECMDCEATFYDYVLDISEEEE